MRALCILGVKNEAAFLLDWLAHHRACGFSDFLVYSNDCSDGTDLMLDRLSDMGWLTHVRNDGPHDEGPQWSMLKSADRHPLRQAADWILFSDIDEFVNIHTGDRRLPALLAALVLFQFGTGPVRGFAVTLSIGIIASLFTAIFVSRVIFDFFLHGRNVKRLSI